MSVHTGRMSNREAYNTLTQLRSTARTLDRADLASRAHVLLNTPVDAEQIRQLLAEVNKLTAARLLNSATVQPYASAAATVFLFGVEDHAHGTARAAHVAQGQLSVPASELMLVDASPVSTPTAVGTRYTFRVRSPYDAPSTATAAL